MLAKRLGSFIQNLRSGFLRKTPMQLHLSGALALILFAVLVTLHTSLKPQWFTISPDVIRHDSGCAYVVGPLKERPQGWPLTYFQGDSTTLPIASNLRIYEDGLPLGEPHALHDRLRDSSSGGYSHWGNLLYLATSDCTDPGRNGRSYEVSVTPISSTFAKGLLVCLIVFMAFLLNARFLNNPRYTRFRGFFKRTLEVGTIPATLEYQRLMSAAIFLVLFSGSCAFLFLNWSAGRTVGLAVGGAFQVSDASAYWWCANSLIEVGHFGSPIITGEWCQRRAIYPSFLAGLSWIGGENIFRTLLLQASLVCAAIFILVRHVITLFGVISAFSFSTVIFLYVMTEALAVTMTESLGVILGSLGLAVMLIAAERRSIITAGIGILIFSTAMNARAGALGVLLLLVLWSGLLAIIFRQSIFKWLSISIIATFGGFFLQAILVTMVGGNSSSSHGNLAYTLYGLSVGGKGWSQVLIDYPNLPALDSFRSKAIYGLALDNFLRDPWLFLNGIFKNLSLFIANGAIGFDKFGSLAVFPKIFWWVGWIPLVVNWRNPVYLLILLCSVGVLVSAPIIYIDGGPRLFAATAVVDSLQIAIGFTWIISVLLTGLKVNLAGRGFPSSSVRRTRIPWEIGLGLVLINLLFLPHFVERSSSQVKVTDLGHCSPGETRLITKIGASPSLLLDISNDHQVADFSKGQVSRDALVAGTPVSAWWREELVNFKGRSLLLAYQFDQSDPRAPGPIPIFSHIPLSSFHEKLVKMCVSDAEKIKIFDVEYNRLSSISEIDRENVAPK